MNHDTFMIAYIIFIAIFGVAENIAMARAGSRLRFSGKDSSFLQVIIPFYLTLIAAPVEYIYSPHKPALGFCIAGGVLFMLGTIIRTKAHLDLGKAFSVTIQRQENQRLIKVGLYRTVRHPLYLAVLLIMIAAPLFLADILTWLVTCLGLAGILIRIRLEERYLQQEFPDYVEYIQNTWKLIPWIY